MTNLMGGDATANADMVRSVLSGEKGPKRDVVLLNAAYGLMAAGKTLMVQDGIQLVAEAIDSGKAMAQLNQLIIMIKDQLRQAVTYHIIFIWSYQQWIRHMQTVRATTNQI